MEKQNKIQKRIEELKKQIANLLENLVFDDWLRANKKSARMVKGRFTETGRERKWKPYTLSDGTLYVHRLHVKLNKEKLIGTLREKILTNNKTMG